MPRLVADDDVVDLASVRFDADAELVAGEPLDDCCETILAHERLTPVVVAGVAGAAATATVDGLLLLDAGTGVAVVEAAVDRLGLLLGLGAWLGWAELHSFAASSLLPHDCCC